jgi:hypothetical protein
MLLRIFMWRGSDSSRVLLEESRTLECKLGCGTTDQHYLSVPSESAGDDVKFAGLRQGAKVIWRGAYRVQATPTSGSARFSGGRGARVRTLQVCRLFADRFLFMHT